MDWVKSLVGYYRLIEIATGSDAMEVMFKRADALAGELRSGGFIPDAMLPQLCRKPAQAKKTAQQLVDTGLWVRVDGGFVIVDWATINAELVKLQDRKRRDRERKRASRATSHDVSEDASADSPADGHGESLYESERKSKKKTAAAAAVGAAAAAHVDNQPHLPPVLEIFRGKLQAHTALRALRFDTLDADQIARLVALVALHGDDRLVTVARDTCRTPAPTYVTAFLGTWDALPHPGQRLAVVRPQRCPEHEYQQLTPGGVCIACAGEQNGAAR